MKPRQGLVAIALALAIPLSSVTVAHAAPTTTAAIEETNTEGGIGNDLTPEQIAEVEELLKDPEVIGEAQKLRQVQEPQTVTVYGVKGWVAKKALEGARWGLQKMGPDSWKKAIAYLGPLAGYITYDKTMDAINIAIDLSGSIEERLEEAFKRVGFNDKLAGIAARAVSFILL